MKTSTFSTFSCRHCRYYQAEGRRGGNCNKLDSPVRAEWKACVLAAHPFASPWDKLEEVALLESSFALDFPGDHEFLEEGVQSSDLKLSEISAEKAAG